LLIAVLGVLHYLRSRKRKVRHHKQQGEPHPIELLICSLEPVVLDLERAAKIAEKLFIEDPDEEEIELGRFAVYQFRAMARDLVRLWNEEHEAARTKPQSAWKNPALTVVQQDAVTDTAASWHSRRRAGTARPAPILCLYGSRKDQPNG
jgi:hypothetical protein